MTVVVAFTFGLVIWIVLWALGAKGFDGFMIATLFLLLGATAKILLPKVPGNRDE